MSLTFESLTQFPFKLLSKKSQLNFKTGANYNLVKKKEHIFLNKKNTLT